MRKSNFIRACGYMAILLTVAFFSSCSWAENSSPDKQAESKSLSQFEEMLAGFPECEFKNVYVDMVTKKPAHKYFIERDLEPCEKDDEFAYYCINESFHGLKVYKIMIPAKTFDIHSIYIIQPIEKSRLVFLEEFGSEFRRNTHSDNGEIPELLRDPKNFRRSILTCSERAPGL